MFMMKVKPAIAQQATDKMSCKMAALKREFRLRQEAIKEDWDPGTPVGVGESLLWALPGVLCTVLVCSLFDCGIADVVDGTLTGWLYAAVITAFLWLVLALLYLGFARTIAKVYAYIRDRKLRKQETVFRNCQRILWDEALDEASDNVMKAMDEYDHIREAYIQCESAYRELAEEMTDALREAIDDQKKTQSMDSQLNAKLYFRLTPGWISILNCKTLLDGTQTFQEEDTIAAECTFRFFKRDYKNDLLHYTAFVDALFRAIRNRMLEEKYEPAVAIRCCDGEEDVFELSCSFENPLYVDLVFSPHCEEILRNLERGERIDLHESME